MNRLLELMPLGVPHGLVVSSGTLIYYMTGNVGIGTANPQDLLHIDQGNSGTGIRFERHDFPSCFDIMRIGNIDNGFTIHNVDDDRYDLMIFEDGDITIGDYYNAGKTVQINDALKLKPRSSAPTSPEAGLLYFDSTINVLRCYDGSQWRNCW